MFNSPIQLWELILFLKQKIGNPQIAKSLIQYAMKNLKLELNVEVALKMFVDSVIVNWYGIALQNVRIL